MRFTTLDDIRAEGFVGNRSVRALQASNCAEVPDVAGVYLIVRDAASRPTFVGTSCGGRFKDREPSVAVDVLGKNWVTGTVVIYIGKAGGGTSSATLRKRLGSYMKFGQGKPVGHWGGRFIWQLADAGDLLVCWKAAGSADAIEMESALIREFNCAHGARPFANLRD